MPALISNVASHFIGLYVNSKVHLDDVQDFLSRVLRLGQYDRMRLRGEAEALVNAYNVLAKEFADADWPPNDTYYGYYYKLLNKICEKLKTAAEATGLRPKFESLLPAQGQAPQERQVDVADVKMVLNDIIGYEVYLNRLNELDTWFEKKPYDEAKTAYPNLDTVAQCVLMLFRYSGQLKQVNRLMKSLSDDEVKLYKRACSNLQHAQRVLRSFNKELSQWKGKSILLVCQEIGKLTKQQYAQLQVLLWENLACAA